MQVQKSNINKGKVIQLIDREFHITGTVHGSFVCAKSEGEARRMFHEYYGGESIVSIFDAKNSVWLQKIGSHRFMSPDLIL